MTSTNIKKIGLGTVQFGLDYGISNSHGITGLDEVKNILKYAREIGIDLIDTAYGYGRSESVLGEAWVEDFRVVTKYLPESYGINIKLQVNRSLRRLRIRKLYGLLAHRPSDIMDKPDVWNKMRELKEAGIVQKIGFSFNTLEEIELVLAKGYTPDLIQVPFNYFDNRFRQYMVYLNSLDCEIHSRSAFLQGLFFVPPQELNDFFNEVKPVLCELQKYKESLSGLLLRYCLEQPFIDKVVFGVNNLNQLQENISSLDTNMHLPELEYQVTSKILTPSEWPVLK